MKNDKKDKKYTDKTEVSCTGLEAPYDHPMVYLKINEKDKKIQCPYCGHIFILKD